MDRLPDCGVRWSVFADCYGARGTRPRASGEDLRLAIRTAKPTLALSIVVTVGADRASQVSRRSEG